MSRSHVRRIVVAGCVVALHLASGGCTAAVDNEPRPATTWTVGERDVIGRTVTVSGKIFQVLTPTSFVMAADGFGDLSLLVLSHDRPGLAKGQNVTFDGNVQVFRYEAYREEYGLVDAPAYAPYEGEKILVMLPASSVTTPPTGATHP